MAIADKEKRKGKKKKVKLLPTVTSVLLLPALAMQQGRKDNLKLQELTEHRNLAHHLQLAPGQQLSEADGR